MCFSSDYDKCPGCGAIRKYIPSTGEYNYEGCTCVDNTSDNWSHPDDPYNQ